MITSTQTKIQKLEDRIDLDLLMEEDLVNIEGIGKALYMWPNESQGSLYFFNRNKDNSLTLIEIDSSNIKIKNGNLLFEKPYKETNINQKNSSLRTSYNIYNKLLIDVGL